jgi:hypothetical protein
MEITDYIWITRQQLWGYKVEEKLHLGVRKQKRLNTTAMYEYSLFDIVPLSVSGWLDLVVTPV